MEDKDILTILDTRIAAAKGEGNFTEELCMKQIKNKIINLMMQRDYYKYALEERNRWTNYVNIVNIMARIGASLILVKIAL